MFEQQESTPWNQSLPVLIGAIIVFPPLGLALLWARGDVASKTKVLGTLGIAMLAIG
jgi:hypothetical protein